MTYSDDVAGMRAADDASEHLASTIGDLRSVLHEIFAEQSERGLAPEYAVHVSAGEEGQPVLVIELRIALDEDFAVSEWPADQVASLKRRVREAVRGTSADDYGWYILVQTQASAAA